MPAFDTGRLCTGKGPYDGFHGRSLLNRTNMLRSDYNYLSRRFWYKASTMTGEV